MARKLVCSDGRAQASAQRNVDMGEGESDSFERLPLSQLEGLLMTSSLVDPKTH